MEHSQRVQQSRMVRGGAQPVAQHPQAVGWARPGERAAEPEIGVAVVGLAGDCPTERRHRRLGASEFGERRAEIDRHHRGAGRKPRGAAEERHRPLHGTAGTQQIAQVVAGCNVGGVEHDETAISRRRFRRLSPRPQHPCEGEAQAAILRRQAQELPEHRHGLVGRDALGQHRRQTGERIRMAGAQRQRPAVMRGRLVRSAQRHCQFTDVGVEVGNIRSAGDGPTDPRHCLHRAAFLPIEHAQQVQGVRLVRLDSKDSAVKLPGLRQSTLKMIFDRESQRFLHRRHGEFLPACFRALDRGLFPIPATRTRRCAVSPTLKP